MPPVASVSLRPLRLQGWFERSDAIDASVATISAPSKSSYAEIAAQDRCGGVNTSIQVRTALPFLSLPAGPPFPPPFRSVVHPTFYGNRLPVALANCLLYQSSPPTSDRCARMAAATRMAIRSRFGNRPCAWRRDASWSGLSTRSFRAVAARLVYTT